MWGEEGGRGGKKHTQKKQVKYSHINKYKHTQNLVKDLVEARHKRDHFLGNGVLLLIVDVHEFRGLLHRPHIRVWAE